MSAPIIHAEGGARQRSPRFRAHGAPDAYSDKASRRKRQFLIDGKTLALVRSQATVLDALVRAQAVGDGVSHGELRHVGSNVPDLVFVLRGKGVGIVTVKGKPSRWHLVSHVSKGGRA